jgi:hypothetical protein
MSEFLFVIPTGWTQISQEMIDAVGGVNVVGGWVQTSDFHTLGQALREAGGPESISEAVFFNSEILAVR